AGDRRADGHEDGESVGHTDQDGGQAEQHPWIRLHLVHNLCFQRVVGVALVLDRLTGDLIGLPRRSDLLWLLGRLALLRIAGDRGRCRRLELGLRRVLRLRTLRIELREDFLGFLALLEDELFLAILFLESYFSALLPLLDELRELLLLPLFLLL